MSRRPSFGIWLSNRVQGSASLLVRFECFLYNTRKEEHVIYPSSYPVIQTGMLRQQKLLST